MLTVWRQTMQRYLSWSISIYLSEASPRRQLQNSHCSNTADRWEMSDRHHMCSIHSLILIFQFAVSLGMNHLTPTLRLIWSVIENCYIVVVSTIMVGDVPTRINKHWVLWKDQYFFQFRCNYVINVSLYWIRIKILDICIVYRFALVTPPQICMYIPSMSVYTFSMYILQS